MNFAALAGFTAFTGIIPGDGDDDRVTLSRSNPMRNTPQHPLQDNRKRDGDGAEHGELNTSIRERNNG